MVKRYYILDYPGHFRGNTPVGEGSQLAQIIYDN